MEEIYQNVQTPEDGLLIHGLFIDAGKWDSQFMILVDANIGNNIDNRYCS